MATISGDLKTKFTDDLGEPLVGGKVYTYHAGTSTPKDSYQDKEFAIVNTNPIVLDDAGSCDLYLNGLYRLRVLDKDGVFVEERDYMTQGDSTGSSIVDNANAITQLKSDVQTINNRSVLKLDEDNFIIGHGSANSATVYDVALRSDKAQVAVEGDAESPKDMFVTYPEQTEVGGNTVEKGAYFNPDLVKPVLGSAASRNTGTSNGQIPLAEQTKSIARSEPYGNVNNLGRQSYTVVNTAPNGINYIDVGGSSTPLPERWNNFVQFQGLNSSKLQIYYPYFSRGASVYLRRSVISSQGGWQPFEMIYTTGNTTKDSATGFLKASSPVLHVYNDKITKIHEAEELDISVDKKGVGHYEIHGTTGLRENDGWFMSPPRDVHGNVLSMVDLEEKDGVVILRTYKKKFDFETVSIVHDYDNPMDIPEGVCVELRFNDLPEEQLDGPIE